MLCSAAGPAREGRGFLCRVTRGCSCGRAGRRVWLHRAGSRWLVVGLPRSLVLSAIAEPEKGEPRGCYHGYPMMAARAASSAPRAWRNRGLAEVCRRPQALSWSEGRRNCPAEVRGDRVPESNVTAVPLPQCGARRSCGLAGCTRQRRGLNKLPHRTPALCGRQDGFPLPLALISLCVKKKKKNQPEKYPGEMLH